MKYRKAFLQWLPLALSITGVCLLINLAVQQNYRESLNDPQIQLAEDLSQDLVRGASATAIVKNLPAIDIAQSLTPWIETYDDKGMPTASSGFLDGQMPTVPKGVLEAASANAGKDTNIPGQNRITWQPASGVREAIVVQFYTGTSTGYVVAGRNMFEVENREDRLSTIAFLVWIITLFGSLMTQLLVAAYMHRN